MDKKIIFHKIEWNLRKTIDVEKENNSKVKVVCDRVSI